MTGEAEQLRKRQRTEAADGAMLGDATATWDPARPDAGAEAAAGEAPVGQALPGVNGGHEKASGEEAPPPGTADAVPVSRDDRLLRDVAASGKVTSDWAKLLEALEGRLDQVLCYYAERFGELEDIDGVAHRERCRMLQQELRSFDGPPFTIQRLAEVLLTPHPQYTATHKLVNGLEKLLSVSSTLESFEDD